jgi:hypothetical protein
MHIAINKVRFGLWTASIILALILMIRLLAPDFLFYDCRIGTLHAQSSNVQNQNGVYFNEDGTRQLKMLQQEITLKPKENYLISFLVKEVTGTEPAIISADFFDDQTDFDGLKFQIKLEPGIKDKTIVWSLASKNKAPDQAMLRMYYDSPTRVAISDVRVIAEKKIIRLALAFLFLIGSLVLAVLTIFYIRECATVADTDSDIRRRQLQWSFVFVFLAFISAPWLQAEFKLFRIKPVDENRNKVKKPDGNMLVRLFVEGADYGKRYENFFNDNFGFRDLFIKLNNQLDFSLFNRSDEVFIGKQGWMEYRSVMEVEEIRAERFTNQDWGQIQSQMLKLNAYLRSLGVTLIIVPIPLKFSIYPELIPADTISRPEKTAFMRFYQWMENQPQLHYVPVPEILSEAKAKQALFYKSDFHWNEFGAFIIAEQVVNTLGRLGGQAWRWHHPLQYHQSRNFVGGLGNSLGLLHPPEEGQISIDRNWEETGAFLKPEPPFDVLFQAEPAKAAKLLPKTLLLGVSFSFYFFDKNGFYENFSEVYFLHSKNMHDLPKLLPKDVKFVVYQFIEVNIGNSFKDPNWWPALSGEIPENTSQSHGKDSGKGK